MKQSTPSKTVQIRLKAATIRLLAKLQVKTGLAHRNSVIRYAIARLAEREGIAMAAHESRAAQRKAATR